MKTIKEIKLSKISNKKYRELYRIFNRDQYMLLHKGYIVHKYDFETFKKLYDEKRKENLILKDSKQRPMARLLNESKVYTHKMAQAMAESKGLSTKEWKQKMVRESLQGNSTSVENINLDRAADVRRAVFQYFLTINDNDYNIAHAEYEATV
ncbi:MAG: hypothetical protein ACI4OP_03360 [Candidatus Coprovivens sp.]